jgi:predicted ATPase
MSEKLIIRNFGPIKDMSFDFKKINILIGEQGTGKSTVSKLIAAIINTALGRTTSPSFLRYEQYDQKEQFISNLKIYEIDNHLTNSTFIKYSSVFFNFSFEKGKSSITKTKTTGANQLPLEFLNSVFIPADRSAVNLLSNEVLYSLNEISQDLPIYFVRFGQLFNRAKKNEAKYDFSDTLGVIYKYENNQDKIVIGKNKVIKISDASSAVQTNVPLLVVLFNLRQTIEASQSFMAPDLNLTIIEEPELNCFPSLQNSIVKYIIGCIRPFNDEYLSRIIITTHSPYILTSLNNLLQAHITGTKKNNSKKVSDIVDKKNWVNPDEISAYMLLPNGKCESIFDKQEKLIKAEMIDSVSTSLNQEFDKLLRIEFDIKKRKTDA